MPIRKPFGRGVRVEHVGCRLKGHVLASIPYPDGTYEYIVQPECSLFGPGKENNPTWWASYHVREVDEEWERRLAENRRKWRNSDEEKEALQDEGNPPDLPSLWW